MPYYNRDPKRDHDFDNHPYKVPHSFGGEYESLLSVSCILRIVKLVPEFWPWGRQLLLASRNTESEFLDLIGLMKI